MPPKAPARIYSNVDTASQHPDRSTAGSDKVDALSSQRWEQPSDWTIPWQSPPRQQVVSAQLKKFLVTCLVVAGIGWLLAVVGICTDHWISFSLHDVGHSVTESVDTRKPVTEGVDTVNGAVTDGGVVTNAVNIVQSVVETQATNVTDVVAALRKPSPEKNAVGDAEDSIYETDIIEPKKEPKIPICEFIPICRSLDADRGHIGLFHCGMDCDRWMFAIQGLVLTGLLYATSGMVLMILHLVLKGRKSWMPTVGGVLCLIGGIFIITGIMGYFFRTSYNDEPEWSFLLTYLGALLFMVAGVLVLVLQWHARRAENRCEEERSIQIRIISV